MNHRLLKGSSGDAWRTFIGSSSVYVDAFAKRFRGSIRLGTRVRSVEREHGLVQVITERGAETFDRVVLATHGDVSLKLLADPHEEGAGGARAVGRTTRTS